MTRIAALSASLEIESVDADDDITDLLAVLGTCISRMLTRELRRHEVLSALFPEENTMTMPAAAMGAVAIRKLLDHGMTAEGLDHYIERLLRHAI